MSRELKINKKLLLNDKQEILNKYNEYKSLNLKLDMSRGKPCTDQLVLTTKLFDKVNINSYILENGFDSRNYGILDGVPKMKNIFSEMLGVDAKNIIVGGNSSLNLMYDMFVRALLFGLVDSEKPWKDYDEIIFLCPSPGYDRHFAICESFGIKMISIPMNEDGPDTDRIQELVKSNDNIKGIWCVPKYSNPTGVSYSDKVVKTLASMKTKSSDFTIFWDNAYSVHHLNKKHDKILNIIKECNDAGNPNRSYMFCSTSKISYAGSGISAMASSIANIEHVKKYLSKQTIGYDKINQLTHALALKNMDCILEHMEGHSKFVKPRFDIVLNALEKNVSRYGIANWTNPNGGYFISLDTMTGCAKSVVKKAADAGVKLTPAGATYPYGLDPNDSNIRIAPTFPSLEDLKKASEVLCLSIKLATIEKLEETNE